MRTSHLEIRRKILNEKDKVSDEELFGSPAFAAYLSDIGETVAKRYGRPFKVKTYWDTEPNAQLAWTDNHTITINTGNHVTMSFPTRETKALSLVGLWPMKPGISITPTSVPSPPTSAHSVRAVFTPSV